MFESIKNKVSSYYTDKLKVFGATPQGVDWNSAESQSMRFEQLIKVLPQGKETYFSVLDYGCGYGAMYPFLQQKYPKIQFTGFDISEDMINECKKIYSGTAAEWYWQDKNIKPVDYVMASGIFNVRMGFSSEDWLTYILKTLHTIDSLASKGFSFNLLTSYSDKEYMRENLFYAEPEVLFKYCKTNFSKYVALLHDYPLYEFSILVRK